MEQKVEKYIQEIRQSTNPKVPELRAILAIVDRDVSLEEFEAINNAALQRQQELEA